MVKAVGSQKDADSFARLYMVAGDSGQGNVNEAASFRCEAK